MAIYGVAVVVAPIPGPTLGGSITDNDSWRWIFDIFAVLALVALPFVFMMKKSVVKGRILAH